MVMGKMEKMTVIGKMEKMTVIGKMEKMMVMVMAIHSTPIEEI